MSELKHEHSWAFEEEGGGPDGGRFFEIDAGVIPLHEEFNGSEGSNDSSEPPPPPPQFIPGEYFGEAQSLPSSKHDVANPLNSQLGGADLHAGVDAEQGAFFSSLFGTSAPSAARPQEEIEERTMTFKAAQNLMMGIFGTTDNDAGVRVQAEDASEDSSSKIVEADDSKPLNAQSSGYTFDFQQESRDDRHIEQDERFSPSGVAEAQQGESSEYPMADERDIDLDAYYDDHAHADPEPGEDDYREDAAGSAADADSEAKYKESKTAHYFCEETDPIGPWSMHPTYLVYYMTRRYSTSWPARRPGCCVLIWHLVIGAIVGLGIGLMPVEIDTDFSAFTKTDLATSCQRDSFLAALSAQAGKSDSRRLASRGLSLYTSFDLYIYYRAKSGAKSSNLLNPDLLSLISDFENEFRHRPEFVSFCHDAQTAKWDQTLCDPGVSVVNFFMPTLVLQNDSVVPAKVQMNGRGLNRLPLQPGLTWMNAVSQATGNDMVLATLPVGFKRGPMTSTDRIRSLFRFKTFCCTSADPPASQTKLYLDRKAQYQDLIKTFIIPFIDKYKTKTLEPDEDDESQKPIEFPVEIAYSGTLISDVEVIVALMRDAFLAVGCVLFVLLYVMFHTRSICLSLVGLLIVILAIPISYVEFRIVSGPTKMSLASCMSIFLIVGLGSDVLFVFTDTWRDSILARKMDGNRLLWTYIRAGKSTLATTISTTLSFISNMVSVLKALREFGMFMGFCVFNVWILVMAVYMPLLLYDELRFARFSRLLGAHIAQRDAIGQIIDEGTRVTTDSRTRWMENLGKWVIRWAKSIVAFTVLSVVGSTIGFCLTVKVESSVPSILPPNHNQNIVLGAQKYFAVPGVNGVFGNDMLDVASAFPVCDLLKSSGREPQYQWTTDLDLVLPSTCPLAWCEAVPLVPATNATECQCYRKEYFTDDWGTFSPDNTQPCQTDSYFSATQIIVGLGSLSSSQKQSFADHYQTSYIGKNPNITFDFTNGGVENSVTSSSSVPIFVQDWDTGQYQVQQTSFASIALTLRDKSECGWQEICFCGSLICRVPSDYKLRARVQVSNQFQYRALATVPATVSINQQALVEVVFGITANLEFRLVGSWKQSELWKYNPMFDLSNPWTQRAVYSFCQGIPAELLVTEARCIIHEYRAFLRGQGKRFPSLPSDYKDQVTSFLSWNKLIGDPPIPIVKYAWVVNGMPKALYLQFLINFNTNGDTRKATALHEVWNRECAAFNDRWDSYTGEIWNTASLWVRVEATTSVILSTISTMAVNLVISYIGVVVFVCDFVTTTLVVSTTVVVVCALGFIITAIANWPVGPMEAIALIVFVGYSITYSLHVGFKYVSHDWMPYDPDEPPKTYSWEEKADLRKHRVVYAFTSVGAAAIGSSVTSAGCAVFLVACLLTIFQRLGLVVLCVTVLSIITAMFPLPAALVLMGPVRNDNLLNRLPCFRRKGGMGAHSPSGHDHL